MMKGCKEGGEEGDVKGRGMEGGEEEAAEDIWLLGRCRGYG
jgi:hypothetical protein